MSTTTGSFNFYQSWKLYKNTVANCSTDSFKMLLTTSSYTPSSSSHTILSDITNEVSGNGYARSALSVTYSQSAGTSTFTFTNPVFTAAGGSIVARYWVVYDDTVSSPVKPLVAWGLLDTTPADVTTPDTNTLTFTITGSFYTET